MLFAVVGGRPLEDYDVGRRPLMNYDQFGWIEIQIELGFVLAMGALALGLVVGL